MRALTVNSGSSSLKLAVYEIGPPERLLLSARAQRIGLPGSSLHIQDSTGAVLFRHTAQLSDFRVALETFISWLKSNREQDCPDAVGHRIVHGVRHYFHSGNQ